MSEPTSTPTDADTGAQDATSEPANYTPPASQAELDRIISERVNRTKNQFKDYQDLKAKAAELDQIKAANQTEQERLANDLNRWQSEAETWRKTAVGNRIEALASSDFADPSDAVGQLDPVKYLDAGGQIDEAAIRADLAEILERKPHWRRPEPGSGAPRVPLPNPAQGSSGGRPATDPAQEFAAVIRSHLGP